MILLLVLLAFPGFSLEIGLELGWAGRPVLDAVNPLWITISNPDSAAVRGELQVTMEFGSAWRGAGTYAATVPFVVGAFSKARFLLPWPVRAGGFLVRATAFSGKERLGEGELRFSVEPGPLRASVGPPPKPVDFLFSPADLPADPLLLSPFSELQVSIPLRASEKDVVQAWQVFLSGEVRVEAEVLRDYLAGLRPASSRWIILLPGLFLYVLGLTLALPRLAQGRPNLPVFLLAVFLAFSLVYSVSRESANTKSSVLIRIERPGFTSFCLEVLGIAPWVNEEMVLDGWWVEFLPGREWQGRDLLWRFAGEAWQTVIRLEPGVPRLLFRITQEAPLSGEVIPPPPWLSRGLSLSWSQATVMRAGEIYVVRLQ
jgi:hypothetical protein